MLDDADLYWQDSERYQQVIEDIAKMNHERAQLDEQGDQDDIVK